MSAIYDNWERLVAAALRKEQLWQLFHDHSRSPSILSEASDFSSSFNLSSRLQDLAFDFPGSSSRKVHPKLVLLSDFSPPFDAKDVYLASAELLGRGTFGSVYTAALNNGVRIVVKRLKLVNIPEPDFKRHMDIVGNVRHDNVVALRAYYCFEDERLMLYDYYRKGSVYALLHGQGGQYGAHVDWETRLKIAIGAARGIAEIHGQNGGKLVHGNIKSSNIFLNPEQYGCVSDVGLANMIETTFMPTARCQAPEVKNTRNVSQASDVYSFGIVLLELLTRRSTAHVPGGPEAVDLVKFVTSAKSKERAAKVFDADLLKYPTIKEAMVKMLQIGMKCVEKSIKKRPKISEVVKTLEDISPLSPTSSVSSKRNLVFVDNANPTFDLEDMLRASAEVLGKGTFGTSYKATLGSGTTIAVKRLKDVVVTLNNFQQQMEIIGRMRHENVADLRAYYFSEEEKLLVYDYHYHGSISALLHGKFGADRGAPLNWDTRLKIAIGAARGIAHIHRQDGGKFVHGNITSSNLFLNRQEYGLVSDAGLAKLTSPVRWSTMRRPSFYHAPEVKDTKNVSQASDVYSFGVVLLELVTGRESQHITDDGEVVSLVHWVQSIVGDSWTGDVFDVKILSSQSDEESMVQFLQIALDCVAFDPERRPRMPEVVKILEETSGIEPSIDPSLEYLSDNTWEQPSVESRLEYLLDDLLPNLTP